MVDYLAVSICVKHALVKVVVHNIAFERLTCSKADILCEWNCLPLKTATRYKTIRNLVLVSFYCVLSRAVWREMASYSLQTTITSIVVCSLVGCRSAPRGFKHKCV